jgi:cellulose biosynthesis protein BcsQ
MQNAPALKRGKARKRRATKIALFNHKGGVGKTTLTINLADALAEAGRTVLVVDADPQCNVTSFFLSESDLERLLGDSDDDGSGETLWSAVKPVVEGRGGIHRIPVLGPLIDRTVYLLPGDVLLAEYEEVLPEAWTECFARRTRGYDVTTALAQVVDATATDVGADICLYDVGPNVGALNRSVLLDCDYFITPVGADLFSLRALSTVGRSVAKWITDWKTVTSLASETDRPRLFKGRPAFLGYITSAYKVNVGRGAANPHAEWEAKIAPRVRDRVVRDLEPLGRDLVPKGGSNKLGAVKHFHSLAPAAQKHRVPIGALRGFVNPGHYAQVDEAADEFAALAKEMIRRAAL